MIILGISAGHNSSIGLYRDGEIVSLLCEERFSRIKNHVGFPYKSWEYILKENKIKPSDIDLVVVVGDLVRSQMINLTSDGSIQKKFHKGKPSLKKFIGSLVPRDTMKKYSRFKWNEKWDFIFEEYSRILDIPREKIKFIDGHTAHALSCSPNIKPNTLIFTLDGEDGEHCATVSIFDGEKLNWLSKTSSFNSLGLLYTGVTEYLGMKPNDHEFKIMGLAPYSKGDRILKTKEVFDEIIFLKDNSLEFHSTINTYRSLAYLEKKLKGHRFDYVAGAIQLKTEELILEWVQRAIKQTGIKNIALSGGVFMNVKVSMLIAQLEEVESLYVVPSAGDESSPIGCICWGIKELDSKAKIKPIKHLYLGIEYTNEEIAELIEKENLDEYYKIKYHDDIEKEVAGLLSKGKIVARLKGKCEFGARALGNRSIIADASNKDTVMEINEQIKNRDFWMPFAPSILQEKEKDYIINPKKIFAPWMVLGFNTTKKAKEDLIAGLHPYDLTSRPQIVTKEFNPDYHKILTLFEKQTGRGGVLNTSFNLHGDPMVCSPEDAIYTFKNSGLKYLAMENYLFSKEDVNQKEDLNQKEDVSQEEDEGGNNEI